MEDYIQFSAKTKNEAITKACLELGTSSDQLDIQVISEGSSGFFGIGSKPAVIKVRRIEPVSDMQEIDELVESVKLDADNIHNFRCTLSRNETPGLGHPFRYVRRSHIYAWRSHSDRTLFWKEPQPS